MTEAEWLACGNPGHLLIELNHKISDRKLKLFRCALSRGLTSFPDGMDTDRFLRLAEDRADNIAPPEAVEDAITRIERTAAGLLPWAVDRWVELHLACLRLLHMLREDGPYGPHMNAMSHFGSVSCFADRYGGQERIDSETAAYLRCIVGNPFRPYSFHPTWRTDTVLALAGGMYDGRTFNAMPILADALQEAGCDNADLLGHLRDLHATHVRGCWALDLVLGRE